jgi:hypothetical protein
MIPRQNRIRLVENNMATINEVYPNGTLKNIFCVTKIRERTIKKAEDIKPP